ncbi:hypothetical protein AMS68_000182 [Peltaster fructicola]|uniref:Uncharacterized protein n=1 Tax=Peltaster fructicola TaxID=286661 RepID=A0A6H0XJ61_9PEZI|nr:hypothetical protein AMS68_000182 [Peltaster fructicola]
MSDSQELSNLAADIIFYGEESDDSRARRLDDPRPAQPVRKDSDADVYSDAQESQDDAAGFASLDAIVESPLASPVRAAAPATEPLAAIPESPTKVQASASAGGSGSPTSPTGDWTAATAYWSNLTKEKRAQQEREHLSSDDEAKPKRSFFKRNKKTKEAEASPVSTPVKAAPPPLITAPSNAPSDTAPASPRTSIAPAQPVKAVAPPAQRTKSPPPAASSQPLKPALKKTVRAPAPTDGEIHIPRTMRGAGAPSKTTRPQSALVTTSSDNAVPRARPASVSSPVNGPRAPRDAAPITASSLTANKLGKKFQDDSDSESSFKKKHRPSSSVDSSGKYNMRRSMRAGSVESSSRVASPPPGARSSLLRSLSPSSVTSGRGESLRQSLRGAPPDAGARTLRGSKPTSSAKQRPASSGMASRFKSRFVDSDDEDDAPRSAARPAYRSRFVDSDEEDGYAIPEELTPVRGIPKRKGQEDGDSTDLDDESDGGRRHSPSKKKNANAIVPDPAAVEKAMEAARRKLGIAEPGTQPSNEGGALKQGTMRDRDNDKVLMSDMMSDNGSVAGATGTKKRGILGSFLKRNRSSSRTVHQVDSPAPPPPLPASPRIDTNTTPQSASKQSNRAPTSPSSPSAAKLVRRSSHQPPKLQRGNSGLSTATAPAGPLSDEHWPLPPPIPNSRMDSFKGREEQRPQTSDEALQSTRPAERPQNRRSFSARVGFTDEAIAHSERDESVVGTSADGAYSQRTGKKKRFGMLRRAFGLYD